MKKKSLCRVGGMKARLKWKKKIVGVKMKRQLKMNMFLQKFAWDRKDGDGSKVEWVCTVTTFVERPDRGTLPLGGKA